MYNYLIIFCFTLFYTSVFYPRKFAGEGGDFHAGTAAGTPTGPKPTALRNRIVTRNGQTRNRVMGRRARPDEAVRNGPEME